MTTRKTRHQPVLSIDEIFQLVDLDRQYISLGFLMQTEEQRQRIFEGRAANESNNDLLIENLRSMEEGNHVVAKEEKSLMKRFLSWLPGDLLLPVVRTYTSMLRFYHCELAVYLNKNIINDDDDDGNDENAPDVLAISVIGDVGAYIDKRRFTADYHWRHIAIKKEELIALLCYAQQQQGKPFSGAAMANSALIPGPDIADPKSFFCSQFIMEMLSFIASPYTQFNRPNTMSNDDVYDVVSAKELQASSVTVVPNSSIRAMYQKQIEQQNLRLASDIEQQEVVNKSGKNKKRNKL